MRRSTLFLTKQQVARDKLNERMFVDATPRNDADWGTDRQIDAENRLWSALATAYPDLFGEDSHFSQWALKATAEERIEYAYKLWTEHEEYMDEISRDGETVDPLNSK